MKAKSLVFVHGLGLGPWLFHEHFEKYYSASGYSVFIPQLPGHSIGISKRDRENISINQCVEYLGNFIADNVTGSYVLIGMSMGGAICHHLMKSGLSPSGLCGVVLMSSPPLNNGILYTLRMLKKLALVHPQALLDFFAGRNNKQLIYSKDSLSHLSDSLINNYSKRIINGFSRLELEIFFNHDEVVDCALGIPVLVMVGEEDHLFPLEIAESTARYYKAKLAVISGLGHMMPIEYHHKRAEKEIDCFLQEIFI